MNLPRSLPTLVSMTCAVLLFAPSEASAAQRFVSPGGQASGACVSSAPCTPEYAVNSAAQPGDDVIIAPGDYTVSAPLVARRYVTVRGVAGQPRPRLFNDGSGTTTFSSGSMTWMYSKMTLAVIEGATARHLGVHQSGNGAGALVVETTSAEDIVAVSTGGSGYAARLTAGSDQFPGELLLRDSVAHAHGSMGTAVDASGFDVQLRNVTALAPGSSGTALRVYGTGFCASYCPGALPARVDARNVVLRGAHADASMSTNGYSGTFAELRIGHSNYRPGAVLVSSQGTVVDEGGNQSAEPLLSNPSAGDYQQRSGSPTIDAGISDGFTGTSDVDGESRDTGGRPDIGADEFVAGGNPAAGTQNGLSTAGPSTTATGPDRSGPVFSLPRSNRSLVASRRGVFRFRIGPVQEDGVGVVTFKTASRVALTSGARISARKVLVLGSSSFRAADGETVTVRLKLKKRSFTVLRRLKRLRVRASVTLRDAVGNATLRRVVFVLRAPQRARSRQARVRIAVTDAA